MPRQVLGTRLEAALASSPSTGTRRVRAGSAGKEALASGACSAFAGRRPCFLASACWCIPCWLYSARFTAAGAWSCAEDGPASGSAERIDSGVACACAEGPQQVPAPLPAWQCVVVLRICGD